MWVHWGLVSGVKELPKRYILRGQLSNSLEDQTSNKTLDSSTAS